MLRPLTFLLGVRLRRLLRLTCAALAPWVSCAPRAASSGGPGWTSPPPPSPLDPGAAGSFVTRELRHGDERSRFQVYLPPGHSTAGARWPVILFLHGAGERGTDDALPTQVGLGPALRRHPGRFPFVVVFPQCAAGSFWTTAPMEERALSALDAAIAEFHGDPQRVALTGISMGGYGALGLAAAHPGRFLALAPVCGGARTPPGFFIPAAPVLQTLAAADPYAALAARLQHLPVWLFHGAEDDVVPVGESRRMAAALRGAAGAPSAARHRFKEYPGVAHDAWEPAYAEPDLPAFLLGR